MKTYIVEVMYEGREVFLLSADDSKSAELRALEFFKNGENSNVKISEVETPTGTKVEEISDTVDLPPHGYIGQEEKRK